MDTGSDQPDECEMLNPMCNVFPITVNCELKTAGVNGKADVKSDICMLGQNVMNQKIYLVLWIWFAILFSVSGCMIVYRVVTCLLPEYQRKQIQNYLKSSDDYAVKRLRLDFDHIGNFFVLTQIARNVTPYTFRKFLDKVVDRPPKINQKEKTEKTIVGTDESSFDSKMTIDNTLPGYKKFNPNETNLYASGMEMGYMDGK